MAQALTVTVMQGDPGLDCYGGGVIAHAAPIVLKLDWQSASDGSVSLGIASTYAAAQVGQTPKPTKLRGYLVRVTTDPDGTTTQPTDQYDITLLDDLSIDVAKTGLTNRSNSSNEQWVPTTTTYIDHELTLTIAAAGDTKGGLIYLHLVP